MKNKKRFTARLIMTLLCVIAMGAIFYNSSLDAVESTSASDPIVDSINAFLRSIHIDFSVTSHMVRKAAHFTEYAILGALLASTVCLYVPRRRKAFLLTLPIGLGVAVIDEMIQLFPAGRSCEVKDMLIDFSGVLFAALIVHLILYLINRHRVKKEGKYNGRTDAE